MPSETYRLRYAESCACYIFAQHLAACDECLAVYHKPGGAESLCAEGTRLRNIHIEAARECAKHDPEFAKKYACLIA